jgi:ABC-type Mn2+/Zn2+ transport system permease subunit
MEQGNRGRNEVRQDGVGNRVEISARRAGSIFVVALLVLFAAGGAWGHDHSRATSESPLDRALQDLVPPNAAASETAHDHPAASPHAGVVQSFLASWSLFRNSYLVGWLIGLVLALVGVVVVARDQVFLGAAVSQASTLGIAVALCTSSIFPNHNDGSWLAHSATYLCCDKFQVVMAVAFSVLAALITSHADRVRRESHEAITGWVFLVSSSLGVLMVAHSPHGLEEIRRIHSSSLIGATAADVNIFAGLLAMTIAFIAFAGRRLLLFVMDPTMAATVGMRVGRWAVAESLWLGLVVGLSIRVSGALFTFGSLVLPPLVAKHLAREVRMMFWISPLVALASNAVGFVLANRYDFPPAQMNVVLLCAALLAAWTLRRLRGRCDR